MTDDPWALPDPVVLMVLILVGIVVALSLALRAVNVLTRSGFKRGRERLTFRYLAMLAWSFAIAAYVWGSRHMLQDETSADLRCKAAVGPGNATHVASYDISYFPLHFGCRVHGVGTFEAAVPGYLNPTLIALVAVAVALSIITIFTTDKGPISQRTH